MTDFFQWKDGAIEHELCQLSSGILRLDKFVINTVQHVSKGSLHSASGPLHREKKQKKTISLLKLQPSRDSSNEWLHLIYQYYQLEGILNNASSLCL